jgi:triphosphoribosyl-dephospho-CoA synthase
MFIVFVLCNQDINFKFLKLFKNSFIITHFIYYYFSNLIAFAGRMERQTTLNKMFRSISEIRMSDRISEFVQTACIWEACARKVGNVHRHRDFADTSLTDFLIAAAAIGPVFRESLPVGETVLKAVEASMNAVGQNVNLGIVLLLAPLARNQTDGFTIEDARNVYQAIRLANPGGLGKAKDQDVRDEPTGTLQEVMSLAAGRDAIARQYANGFMDISDYGVKKFTSLFNKWRTVEPTIIDFQLQWLAEEPDSLIARKAGDAMAEIVRRKAMVPANLGLETTEGRKAGREFDAYLRSDGNRLNPGTTADIIAAVLFVALRERIVTPGDRFPWIVEDWL